MLNKRIHQNERFSFLNLQNSILIFAGLGIAAFLTYLLIDQKQSSPMVVRKEISQTPAREVKSERTILLAAKHFSSNPDANNIRRSAYIPHKEIKVEKNRSNSPLSALNSINKNVVRGNNTQGELLDYVSDYTLMEHLEKIALEFYYKAFYDSSFFYFDKVLKLKQQKFGESSVEVARIYGVMGVIFSRKGNYSSAMKYQENALNIKIE